MTNFKDKILSVSLESHIFSDLYFVLAKPFTGKSSKFSLGDMDMKDLSRL